MTVERRFETGAREDPSDAPGLVLGDDGIAYLVAPDGTRTPVGGGGPISVTRGFYGGDALTIANGASGNLLWTPHQSGGSGDELLDLTNPSHPTVVTAGVYAVTARANPESSMTDGGFIACSLELDTNGDDPSAVCYTPPVSSIHSNPSWQTLGLTWYVPAGGVIRFFVENYDGALGLDFNLSAQVQRIS